ncbi:MAG: alpha/beta fold hydrolase [Nitrospinaceae bacterium]|nr:MAG: alpha/beta fold hydrolase [Nitrospinaceae bacterium]
MESIFDSAEFNNNLFFPRPDSRPPPAGAEDFLIPVASEVVVHARRFPNLQARLSVLFFHGNGEIVSDYNELAETLGTLGAEWTFADYRGYGSSGGEPTLRSVLQDAHIIYRYLKEAGVFTHPVCVMGRSLGSAPAIELGLHYPEEIRGVVIESGYADPVPLVERRGLKVGGMTPEEDALFNNSRKIDGVRCPLLILHGEDDFLISPEEARLNYRQAGSEEKYLEILEGVGHNDMMMAPDHRYFTCLAKFFQGLA